MTDVRTVAIAIPAHDEAALIGRCLDAIARQQDPGPLVVIVLANNCSDATAAIARQPRGIDIRVVEHDFPADRRNAGHARRLAMARAAEIADIVLTTDADCVADSDWVVAHRAAFAGGIDAVAGRVSGDWEELRHHPADALRIGALEWEYLGLIGDAEAVFDPRPHDPAPRHAQRCGANIGITRAMLDLVGGVPPLPTGEDRALLAAVERIDGRVRQDPRPHVMASARTAGRASGGMADALASRTASTYRCDEQFAPADTLVMRWRRRCAARLAWDAGLGDRETHRGTIAAGTDHATFGAAWAAIEPPIAACDRMTPDDLPAQIIRLRQWVERHG